MSDYLSFRLTKYIIYFRFDVTTLLYHLNLGHAYEEMTRQYIDYMPDKLDRSNEEFFTKPGNSLMARLKEGDA